MDTEVPKYFSEDLLQDIFVSEEREVSPCVLKLREGLDSLGIHMFGRRFPLFLYLLRRSQNKAALTVPMLIHLLTAKFSEEGSNSLIYEKAVYGKFVKYVREVASGRRVTSLENILEFVTGASEEPTLGFDQQPCIEFVLATVKEAKIDRTEDDTGNNSTDGEGSRKKRAIPDFMPKSHTCSNTMHLPCGSAGLSLPSDRELFALYDYAFKNTYFGIV